MKRQEKKLISSQSTTVVIAIVTYLLFQIVNAFRVFRLLNVSMPNNGLLASNLHLFVSLKLSCLSLPFLYYSPAQPPSTYYFLTGDFIYI